MSLPIRPRIVPIRGLIIHTADAKYAGTKKRKNTVGEKRVELMETGQIFH